MRFQGVTCENSKTARKSIPICRFQAVSWPARDMNPWLAYDFKKSLTNRLDWSCVMEKMSRRNVFGVAAGAIAGGVLANDAVAARGALVDDTPKAQPGEAASAKSESVYKFRLGAAPARRFGDSSIREHKLHDFPMSASMSAGLIRLAAGDFREPHWHPNSDEWLLVMSGNVRMTIVDGKGEASRFDCGPEDVAFTPQGFGHYVENIGDAQAYVLVVHNNADFTTVDLSEWVAGGSAALFASTLNMPVETLDDAPTKRVFIGRKKSN
jgi:oxalate decarboxylase/phosphoglucose isomerase-like protein (cupin superfamily)